MVDRLSKATSLQASTVEEEAKTTSRSPYSIVSTTYGEFADNNARVRENCPETPVSYWDGDWRYGTRTNPTVKVMYPSTQCRPFDRRQTLDWTAAVGPVGQMRSQGQSPGRDVPVERGR